MRQSDGNAVVTTSSRRDRSAELARSDIRHSGPFRTWPVSDPARPPGGAPVTTWSVLSFRLSLKMHLADWRTRPSRTAPANSINRYVFSSPEEKIGLRASEVPADTLPCSDIAFT